MRPTLRTFALMLLLFGIFGLIGWLLGGFFANNWWTGALIFLVLAGVMNFVSYFWAHKIVLWSYRARIVTEAEAPRFTRIVRRAAQLTGIPMPQVAIVPSKTPNAFATGRNPQTAVVAGTEGILERLDDRELTAVMAHELAHVKDRDILVMTVAATIAGAIAFMARMFWWNLLLGGRQDDRNGNANAVIAIVVLVTAPIAAMLVQLAISRSREYKADEVGARNLGAPDALADALEKLEAANARRPIEFGNPASSSLFIVNPFRGSSFVRLFSTHPPMEERVRRLRAMAEQMGIPRRARSGVPA
ncbi:MAG TPA: zinc metalloprotease HtpX [Thermoplasmata archaeon]|jgi:heat shock protein HtpX|nr:zinc metalloprotease HtpX [Thermoplasmata archaeon]